MVGLVAMIVEVFVGVAKASLLIEVRQVRDEEREDNGVIYSSSSELWLLNEVINICMYMYVYVHVHVHIYMYVYMYVHVCTCMHMYVHVCTCVYGICMYMYVHVHVCMIMYIVCT